MKAIDYDDLEPAVRLELEKLKGQRDRLLAACQQVLARLTEFEMDHKSRLILRDAIPSEFRGDEWSDR